MKGKNKVLTIAPQGVRYTLIKCQPRFFRYEGLVLNVETKSVGKAEFISTVRSIRECFLNQATKTDITFIAFFHRREEKKGRKKRKIIRVNRCRERNQRRTVQLSTKTQL
jgi:hypothetical protein